MLFGALKADSDRDTTDYVFRADVVDADACEGGGLGIDRYMYQVDEDPETRSGTIAAGCPIGDYTIEASIATEADGVVASTSAEFSIIGPSIGLAIPVTEQGAGGVLTLSFGSLAPDADADTTDYIFRADVVDADACEGDGLGVDRYIHQVDEDPETHTGTISADCPVGRLHPGSEHIVARRSGAGLGERELHHRAAGRRGRRPAGCPAPQQAAQSDITLHSDNSAAYGIWSDGTTIWVVDVRDDKLYAYALADGTRLSSKEFDTAQRQRQSQGHLVGRRPPSGWPTSTTTSSTPTPWPTGRARTGAAARPTRSSTCPTTTTGSPGYVVQRLHHLGGERWQRQSLRLRPDRDAPGCPGYRPGPR